MLVFRPQSMEWGTNVIRHFRDMDLDVVWETITNLSDRWADGAVDPARDLTLQAFERQVRFSLSSNVFLWRE